MRVARDPFRARPDRGTAGGRECELKSEFRLGVEAVATPAPTLVDFRRVRWRLLGRRIVP